MSPWARSLASPVEEIACWGSSPCPSASGRGGVVERCAVPWGSGTSGTRASRSARPCGSHSVAPFSARLRGTRASALPRSSPTSPRSSTLGAWPGCLTEASCWTSHRLFRSWRSRPSWSRGASSVPTGWALLFTPRSLS
eukprot:4684537-Pyramimonas_sp.AAC.1